MPSTRRNLTRIFVSTYATTELSSSAEESTHPQSSADHVEQKAHAKVVLVRCRQHSRLRHQQVHNLWGA